MGHSVHLSIAPGQKVCTNCLKKLNSIQENQSSTFSDNSSETDISDHVATEQVTQTLINSLIEILDQSPIKNHSVLAHMRSRYGKRKLGKINAEYQKRLAKVLKVPEENIFTHNANAIAETQLTKDATAFNELMELLKSKINNPETTRAKKIQMLTMVPLSWSRQKVAEYFGVSLYMVRTARNLLHHHGILTMPPPRQGKTLDQDIEARVINFYCDNEFTRIMPGISDRISIKKNVYEQKRLILCTLRELHVAFREKYPQDKISFSKFCTLRPKWCVTAWCSGTHSVCVCTIHQNVILQIVIDAAQIEETYQELIKLLVCDIENRDCMLMRCTQCPKEGELEDYLNDKFLDVDDTITFKEWTAVDRTELITRQMTVADFIELLVRKLINLISHSYIAKQQSNYLRN